jgi:hypothetical protein
VAVQTEIVTKVNYSLYTIYKVVLYFNKGGEYSNSFIRFVVFIDKFLYIYNGSYKELASGGHDGVRDSVIGLI